MIRRPPRSTPKPSSAASDVYKRQVVDQMVAFMGGFDLCFGRYDTPSHPLVDDAAMGPSTTTDPSLLGPALDGAEAHIWPGQDYANERKVEWQILTKPEMDLLPRDKVPRMPWHDVGVQILGQPARDLCRHFCQRWNMLLRSKKHTCLLYTSPSPRDKRQSRMPSSA